MDWQTIFYMVGTIFMVLMIVMLIAIGVFLYVIRQKLSLLSKFTERPVTTATEIGAGIAEGIAIKIRDWTSKKASN